MLGALSLIERQRPNLFIEVHPQFQSDPEGVRRLLDLVSNYYPDSLAYTKRVETLQHKIAMQYFGQSTFDSRRIDGDLSKYPDIFWLACFLTDDFSKNAVLPDSESEQPGYAFPDQSQVGTI